MDKEKREVEILRRIEGEMRRHERCERVHHIVMCGLGVLAVAAFFCGKKCKDISECCKHHKK